MEVNIKISSLLKTLAIVAVITITVGLLGNRQKHEVISNILIEVDEQYNNFFIDAKDVMGILTDQGTKKLEGLEVNEINLRQLEKKLLKVAFIREAEIYHDLKGNLLIEVVQRRPLARILRESGDDYYIGTDGTILPTSDKYASRVLIISGDLEVEIGDNLWDDEYGADLMTMIEFIINHKLWKAQIAQLDIKDNGEIDIYPQVTKQVVSFGKPEDLGRKFKKLEVFYKEILPRKGWNTYSSVSLKYENQIIAK